MRRIWRDAEVFRDPVGGLEADPVDLRGQPVRILPDRFARPIAVELPYSSGETRRHAVGLQEDHDVPDGPLGCPCLGDLAAPCGADPFHLAQPAGVLVDDGEGLHAELLHQAPGKLLADALHEPRAQVALDARKGRGSDSRKGFDLELLAELGVDRPLAREAQAFAGLDAGEVAHRDDLAPGLGERDDNDAPRVLLVREPHPLERPLDGDGRRGGEEGG